MKPKRTEWHSRFPQRLCETSHRLNRAKTRTHDHMPTGSNGRYLPGWSEAAISCISGGQWRRSFGQSWSGPPELTGKPSSKRDRQSEVADDGRGAASQVGDSNFKSFTVQALVIATWQHCRWTSLLWNSDVSRSRCDGKSEVAALPNKQHGGRMPAQTRWTLTVQITRPVFRRCVGGVPQRVGGRRRGRITERAARAQDQGCEGQGALEIQHDQEETKNK